MVKQTFFSYVTSQAKGLLYITKRETWKEKKKMKKKKNYRIVEIN